jgi:hypothetical protein
MNEVDKKLLEEIKNKWFVQNLLQPVDLKYDVDFLIARLEAEVQENERLRDKVLRLVRGDIAQMCSYCGWETPAGGGQTYKSLPLSAFAEIVIFNERNRDRKAGGGSWEDLQNHIKECPAHPLRAAEATCQSLREQSSRWEAQALEAEVRIAELEAKCREYEKFFASMARTYGEGPISNTSESQEGKEEPK